MKHYSKPTIFDFSRLLGKKLRLSNVHNVQQINHFSGETVIHRLKIITNIYVIIILDEKCVFFFSLSVI